MKLIDFDNLGITEDTFMIHIDDYTWLGKGGWLKTLCGMKQETDLWPHSYGMLSKEHLNGKSIICKKCNKAASKKGYDIVTTLVHLKVSS